MTLRRWGGRAVAGLLVLAVGALLVGSVLGQPVLLGYVETGSMAPTMEPGDGFVAVPPSLAGPIEEGDVVVYEARQLNGGGLTTHRVVGETENGYVTRGDANPFTDQDSNEPPVTRGQIRAVALQVGGSTVVLPGIGTVASAVQDGFAAASGALSTRLGETGLQAVGAVVLALGLLLYGLDVVGGGERRRSRSSRSRAGGGTDARLFLLVMTLVVVAPLTAAMVVPGGAQEYAVVSAETDSEAPQVIEQGTTEERAYPLYNSGVLPVVAYLEPTSEGVEVDGRRTTVGSGETVNASVSLSAPSRTGYYIRSVTEHRYLLVLPAGLVDALYGVHPWLPIVAIDLVYGGGFYLLGRSLVGAGRVRPPPASRGGRHLVKRLRGKLRRLVG